MITRRRFIAATGAAAVAARLLSNGNARADSAGADAEIHLGEQQLQCTLVHGGASVALRQLANRSSGFDWAAPASSAGPSLRQADSTLLGLIAGAELTSIRKDVEKLEQGGTRFSTQFRRGDGLQIDWSAKSIAGSSVLEFDAALTNPGEASITGVTSFGPLSLRIRGDAGSLKLHSLSRAAYRLKTTDLGDAFTLRGGGWNAPDSVGWLAIENPEKSEILFVGIQWESAWEITLVKENENWLLSCALAMPGRSIMPNETLQSPRVFLGVSSGDLDDSLREFHDYLRRNVFPPPLPNFPWVTYDIWGTDAAGVEEGIISEIAFAKELGVELFYTDAGWYEGSARNGSGDWFTGVGNWGKEDRVKFPNGLLNISKKVHQAGMKFGLWFAPQVVDSHLVGALIPRAWVSQRDGVDVQLDLKNGWSPITQICLGDPAVVEYLKMVMSEAVSRYELDWLKWDNSGLPGPVCNRADHGHQGVDGALAALRGQYTIYEHLHKRFPQLVLENCGAPSRLDYALARYARANWLSDDTGVALNCRQSQIHGSYAFPATHNTAWIVKSAEIAEQKDPDLLDTLVRSRMIGLFGMGTLSGKLDERVSLYSPEMQSALKRNIAAYKTYRHLLDEDVYHVVPPSTAVDQWDAVAFCKRDGTQAALLVFRNGSPEASRVIKMRGLLRDRHYTVKSSNTGDVQRVPGATLLSEGLVLTLPKPDASDIFIMTSD
ncbi:MAG: alpha-galactosidase [Tepidisphaeraceae bacterium]